MARGYRAVLAIAILLAFSITASFAQVAGDLLGPVVSRAAFFRLEQPTPLVVEEPELAFGSQPLDRFRTL